LESIWFSQLKNVKTKNVYRNLACYVDIDSSIRTGITFTLLGKNGGMFAPLAYGHKQQTGLASLYFPAPFGSQYQIYELSSHSRKPSLDFYEIENILNSENQRKRGEDIRQKLECLYPFLSKTKVKRTVFQTVMNPTSKREIRKGEHPYQIKEGVFWVSATKWTNAITASLELVIAVQQQSLQRGLISEQELVFPDGKVNSATIPECLSFKNETYSFKRALEFATMWDFPQQMISLATV
jgi:hypothetical protein